MNTSEGKLLARVESDEGWSCSRRSLEFGANKCETALATFDG